MSAAPWHVGELFLQHRAGSAARLRETGPKVVRDVLTEQHRDFFALLPFAVLGTVSGDGSVWASLRTGRPGFLSSPDPRFLDLGVAPDWADPAEAGIRDGMPIALLGIDPSTRRRNRLNGKVAGRKAEGFSIQVEQSFGNCPKYVTLRDSPISAPAPKKAPVPLDRLDAGARRLITGADTFFVASYADLPEGIRQVDVSHRGGDPGFVGIGEDGALTIPDYSGNRYFNTLGNLAVNPRAGLAFIDFARGDLLQMSGGTELLLDSPEAAAFPGAERLWRFHPERIWRRDGALSLRWG